MPESYERYIGRQEDEHYLRCKEHRKSLGLPVDMDLYTLECAEEKCDKSCPFNEVIGRK